MNRVDHPGLVQISDYGKLSDGTAYIVMEYLKGETLGQRYRRMSGHMPASEVLQLMRQVASALAAAHDRNIIHCDLKPDNVMIVPDPETPGGERAKLLDFGIARLAGESPSPSTSAPVGTPMYMSPEQCRGAQDLDGKSDVYSLGIMLYQLLVGRWPFPDEGLSDIIKQHLQQEPIPLKQRASWVPDALSDLTQALLQKDPRSRPAMKHVMVQIGLLITSSDKLVRHGFPSSSSLPGDFAQGAAATVDSGGMQTMDVSDAFSAALVQSSGSGSVSVSVPGPVSVTPSNVIPATESAAPPTVGFEAVSSAPHTGPRHGDSETTGRAAAAELSSRSGAAAALVPNQDAASRSLLTRRRFELLAVIVAVAIAPLLMGRFLTRSGPAPAPPMPPVAALAPAALGVDLGPPQDLRAAAVAVEPAVRSVLWSIASVPPGADIVRAHDNEVLGRTPWRWQGPAKAGSVTVRLRLPGFKEGRLTLDTNGDTTQSVTLQRKKADRSPSRGQDQNPLPIMD